MPEAAFRRAIRDYIAREARPADKFGHQPRLYALTLQVGAGLDYDDDIVFAAAWLHDIGVFIGHRPEDPEELARWDNVAYAVETAPAVLESLGFPCEKISAVAEAIRTHQPAAHPTTIEGTILRDADILEQLGAIGVLRTVCKVGRDTRFTDFTSAVAAMRKALATLPAYIRLDTTRGLAAPRIRMLEAFLAAVEAEAQPDLF
ncbi:MAG TPA: HD domain-containing protein [Bryobacteraceae bacterium]|jgi:uncharacterized protein|nr:HD domain-containing protein [Bryobacteraceae bacterium]